MNLKEIKSYLRAHQSNAIDVIEEYLNDRNYKKHALIKMPTGAGKTGVIAVAANFFEDYKKVLIIVPNSTLPIQTKNEIQIEFWKNINVHKPSINLKSVLTSKEILDYTKTTLNEGILILTIQKLMDVHKNNNEIYESIRNSTDLIFFDEGHREPAKEWSQINREMNKKTILFTATPYRNDDMAFKLQIEKYISTYSHKSATDDGVISKLKFETFKSEIANKYIDLAKYIYGIYCANKNDKIIVRLKKHENIEVVVNKVNELAGSNIALGCHSELKASDNFIKHGNQIAKKRDKSVFVHEDMLIEGLNLKKAKHLIMVSRFHNAKMLVQQIGRVLRKNGNKLGRIYVPDTLEKYYTRQWSNYITYDSNSSDSDIHYFEGEFNNKIEFDTDFYKYLKLPKSCSIYASDRSSFELVKNVVRKELLGKISVTNLVEHIDACLWIMCYEKLSYSQLLTNKVYPQKTFECVLIQEIEYQKNFYIIYYDSRNHSFPMKDLNGKLSYISVDSLYNLYPANTEITDLKLDSTANSRIGINQRSVKGLHIENLNTNINERLSYCNSLRGKVSATKNRKVNRAVSILSSRVNDNSRVTLEEYQLWVKQIICEISKKQTNPFFTRFSEVVTPTSEPIPTAVLIDFSELIDGDYIIKYNDKIIGDFNSVIVDTKNFKFELDFNNNKYTGCINIKKYKNSYRCILSIPNLREYEMVGVNSDYKNLMEYFVGGKNFKVFFNQEEMVYNNGIFFKPNINYKNIDLDILDVGKRIRVLKGLSNCKDEKFGIEPTTNKVTHWQLSSMFGFVLNALKSKNSLFKNYDFTDIVCDDLNSEIADFIALDTVNNIIVHIHIKNASDSGTSASAFQDVCGQAQKNAHYLVSNGIDSKQHIQLHYKRWNNKWKNTKTYGKEEPKNKVEFSCNRMCHGTLTGKGFWDAYRKIIKSSNCTKEVWLVTKSLSRKELKAELKRSKPKENISQLLWLLFNTQEVLGEVGADLKIICSE